MTDSEMFDQAKLDLALVINSINQKRSPKETMDYAGGVLIAVISLLIHISGRKPVIELLHGMAREIDGELQ